jgi:hypothetical protein
VENEYCAKHWCLTVAWPERIQNDHLITAAMASRSEQSSYDPYDSSSDDEEYIILNNVAETTLGNSDRAAHWLTAARLYLNSRSEFPQNWAQINPNLDGYHSDAMEICCTFWLPDITYWWQQLEERHWMYANLSNVAHDVFSLISLPVWVEARGSLARDVIGWMQTNTTGETILEKVIVKQFAWANNGVLTGDHPALHTTSTDNDMEMKREEQQMK